MTKQPERQNPIETKINGRQAALVALALILAFGAPRLTYAFSLWEMLTHAVQPVAEAAAPTNAIHDLNTPVLKAATNLDPNPAKGGGDITVVDNVALLAESGPEGTIADISSQTPSNGQISLYVVRKGDTLSSIAKMFGVSTNTILWTNDLKSAKDLHEGDQLVILPISGIKHVVAKGETVASLAKKYKGDVDEIRAFNGLSSDATLVVGDEIIIPYGVESVTLVHSSSAPTEKLHGAGGPVLAGYYLRPIIGGKETQGLHGYNAVDLGTPPGTPVMAAANGTVTVSRTYGYNGGYGLYVVISHPNGTQTLYAHLSSVIVSVGQQVVQGQVIGYSGTSGKSTGPHLHFEVRGAANPF